MENYLMKLRTVLQPIRDSGGYRAIIIDCPPALGMLSMNSLAAADFLLITLQCEYLALEGLGQILRNVERLKAANINAALELGGIVMTMFDVRTKLSRQVVDENGHPLGKLVEILETGANDVYVVRDGTSGKEILLPAIPSVILDLNMDSRILKVHLLDGLV